MLNQWHINLPLSPEKVEKLRAGDLVYLTGEIITGRDAAHLRLLDLLKKGEALPVEILHQVIFYVGPCPAPPGKPIGSAGPTTSGRMDFAAPALLQAGLLGMIGKGQRSKEVVDAVVAHKAVYFLAIGGAGALLAQKIKKSEVIAFPELGTEAMYRLWVEDFPVIVGIDCRGKSVYA